MNPEVKHVYRDNSHLIRSVHHDPQSIERVTHEILLVWDDIFDSVPLGYSKLDNANITMAWKEYSEYLIDYSIPHFERMEKYEVCRLLLDIANSHKKHMVVIDTLES